MRGTRLIPVWAGLLLAVLAPTQAPWPPVGPMPWPAAHAAGSSAQALALARRSEGLAAAGRLSEAEAALKQALDMLSAAHAPPGQAEALQVLLAGVLQKQGRFTEAEALLTAAIQGIQHLRGADAETSVAPLMQLAQLYFVEGRFTDADPLAQRALDLSIRYRGRESPGTAELLVLAGNIQASLGQIGKAAPLYREALAVFQRRPKDFADEIAVVLANLGALYQQAGQYRDALDMSHQAYMADLQLFGADHPSTMTSLANAAVDYELMGMHDDAAGLMARVVDYRQRIYGPDHVETAHALNNAGWIEMGRKDSAKALQSLRPALKTYLANRRLQSRDPGSRAAAVGEAEVSRTILGVLKAARAQAEADPAQAAALLDEAFLAAQSVHRGKAAAALALTTARLAAGGGTLSDLIREQQDLAGRRDLLEQALTHALAQPAAARKPSVEADWRTTAMQYGDHIAQIDATIGQQFPDYAALADPQPLSVAEVRKLLRPDESLVFIQPFGGPNGEATFVFVIGADGATWRESDAGATALTGMVQTLRCGLDIGAWDGEGSGPCTALTGAPAPVRGSAPPFDAGMAFKLYDTLFSGLEPSLKGKSLVLVAADPLASLPFQVLLTGKPAVARPQAEALRDLPWLIRTNALSVLPSVTILRGLRSRGQGSPAPLAYIGFGDPVLAGNRSCARDEAPPETCPSLNKPSVQHISMLSRGATRVDALARQSDGEADLDAVRSLCPLPETGVELRCVAQSLGLPLDVVHTGAAATAPAVLASDLTRYRIVHFATHGLLAGEMQTKAGVVAEPALVLTPPASETKGDDGLLRASTIAGLKLNADWVVLSACNTAAGVSLGGEAMSGLASAFFYAGARALLVSHWPVASDAAVRLTTGAFTALSADPHLGRAEALRRSMLALMDSPDAETAHPSVWAPFSIVGDGGTPE